MIDRSAATLDPAIAALTRLAEGRDAETAGHIDRVCAYTQLLARSLGGAKRKRPGGPPLNDDYIRRLGEAAALHDIGKTDVPDAILQKPGRLTDLEVLVMRRHTTRGAEALEQSLADHPDAAFRDLAVEIAATHHERWDGRGYPSRLARTDIPLAGRIVALADVYDALTSRRVYKDAFPHGEARRLILEGRATHFDPAVVDAFLACEQAFIAIATEYAERVARAA